MGTEAERKLTITCDPDTKAYIFYVNYTYHEQFVQVKDEKELSEYFRSLATSLIQRNRFPTVLYFIIETPVNYGAASSLVAKLKEKIVTFVDTIKNEFKGVDGKIILLSPQQYKGSVPKQIYQNRVMKVYEDKIHDLLLNRVDSVKDDCKADLIDCFCLFLYADGELKKGGIFAKPIKHS